MTFGALLVTLEGTLGDVGRPFRDLGALWLTFWGTLGDLGGPL